MLWQWLIMMNMTSIMRQEERQKNTIFCTLMESGLNMMIHPFTHPLNLSLSRICVKKSLLLAQENVLFSHLLDNDDSFSSARGNACRYMSPCLPRSAANNKNQAQQSESGETKSLGLIDEV